MPEAGGAASLAPRAAPPGGGVHLPALVLCPEREELRHHWLDPMEAASRYVAGRIAAPVLRGRLARLCARVETCAAEMAGLGEAALDSRLIAARMQARRHGLTDPALVECFAALREASRRMLGLYPHPVQLLGGLAMARGAVAEMETGEGKTLTAAMTVAAAAMAGLPVHVVTVNDYLAARDAETLAPLYRRAGLSFGTLAHGMTPPERRLLYGRDIVYASNKEIAFDYLRDRVRLAGGAGTARQKLAQFAGSGALTDPPVMRGLHFALVDEADSVLIDEARTPLILSRETDAAAERVWAEMAHRLARSLYPPRDYLVHRQERRIELTDAGRALLERLGSRHGGPWANRIRREQAVRQALSALLLFRDGDHYVVSDGKVMIVDEYTGRIMGERSWNDGMHQLVEVKEGVEVTARKDVLARMTYQRFFRRYRHLAGMTGTAREVAAELSSVYRLHMVRVPTNAPSRRLRQGARVFASAEARWTAVARRAAELAGSGRPVLIGTRSVAASEQAAARLSDLGVAHCLLNARNEAEEAAVIARAGAAGQVTVATNMAGRGVDIRLEEGVAARGGLHVILTERHDSKRIDRQLEGRTARRGEPGSSEAMLSLEDGLLTQSAGGPGLLGRLARLPGAAGRWAAQARFRRVQRRAEATHARARRLLLDQDRRMGTLLAFTGRPE